MRRSAKLGMLVAAGALAIAVPATAKPVHPSHPSDPGTSHKCTTHKMAYVASGTFVSWSATQSADKTYTGTITVHVTKANHHAAAGKGSDVTYTLTNAKVSFGDGANPPVAGDSVKVIGKITEVAKKCTDQSGAGTITVRKVDIKAPKAPKPPEAPTGTK
jgi:hypothetical protein